VGTSLNPNSDAWGGSWGAASAWGGSWGWSWGPLHEVEEHPEYHGGGGRRQFSDASEDDILRMVQDKWEAIDRAREADHIGEANKKVEPNPSVIPNSSDTQESDRPADAGKTIEEVPSIIAEHWGVSLPNSDTPPDVSLPDSKARRAREEEVLVLSLLELA
jgi:hypothetical protein